MDNSHTCADCKHGSVFVCMKFLDGNGAPVGVSTAIMDPTKCGLRRNLWEPIVSDEAHKGLPTNLTMAG